MTTFLYVFGILTWLAMAVGCIVLWRNIQKLNEHNADQSPPEPLGPPATIRICRNGRCRTVAVKGVAAPGMLFCESPGNFEEMQPGDSKFIGMVSESDVELEDREGFKRWFLVKMRDAQKTQEA